MNAYSVLKKVRETSPLIHHITNWVTIYDCANIVKVFGASPVMAHAKEEAAEMSSIADALVLNIGTLTVDIIASMKIAAKAANKKGIPVIVDVCGAGATKLRNEKCHELLTECRIDIIKGNASEIASIAGENITTKGVDSSKVEKDLIEIARKLAKEKNATVVITGKEDIVSDGKKTYIINNGHKIMTQVVGTGCMAASVIGAFAGREKDRSFACACALVCYGIAAEKAAKKTKGPGSFKEALFDCAYKLDKKTINKMQKVETL